MMKIATFLLTDNEVAPFANNAKFIELTEVYDAVCAASNIEEEARRDGDDALAILELLKNNELSEKAKALYASERELIRFLAHSVFEFRERRQRAEAKLDDDNASKEDIGTAKNDLIDDADIYDYETIDFPSFFSIENYKHRSELRRALNYFQKALDAYIAINIFDLAEDDTRYDVMLAIKNHSNLDFQY